MDLYYDLIEENLICMLLSLVYNTKSDFRIQKLESEQMYTFVCFSDHWVANKPREKSDLHYNKDRVKIVSHNQYSNIHNVLIKIIEVI